MNQQRWEYAVTLTTIVWFTFFMIGFLAFDIDVLCFEDASLPENIISTFEPYCIEEPLIQIPEQFKTNWEIISWIIWIVFAVDIAFKRKNSKNWKQFFRNHWLDIILLIPIFRIFRVARMLRLLKLLKFVKIGTGSFKLFTKSKGLKKKFDSKK